MNPTTSYCGWSSGHNMCRSGLYRPESTKEGAALKMIGSEVTILAAHSAVWEEFTGLRQEGAHLAILECSFRPRLLPWTSKTSM